MPASLAKLLIVDDETAQMTALCKTLQMEGYQTVGFPSANAALAALRDQPFDLVLTDMMMPEMDGITLLRNAFEIDPNLVGIVMTGHGTIGTAVEALKTGALDYILKPFKLSAVLPVLTRALAMRQLRMENIQLRGAVSIYELSMAIAFAFDRDTVLQKVLDAVLQQNPTADVSVLLPSEDGKELHVALARGRNAEHVRTQRLPINDDLLEWIDLSRVLISTPLELLEIRSTFAAALRELTKGVSVPMLTGGRLVGILNFDPGYPQRHITTGQLKALNIVAGTAASALEGTSLLGRLRSAEQRYRRLAENAPDIVFRYELSPERRFAYVSPVITAVTGYSPEEYYADPDLSFKIVHPDDRHLLESLLSGDDSHIGTVTMRWTHKSGHSIWIEQRSVLVRDPSGRVVAIEGIARDISERRQLEEQLRHSQKLEAIGRLTAGVAHDFNNLLTVINGYSDLSLREISPGDPVRRKIDEVKKAGDQAAALTRQLLAFGRKHVSQSKIVDVNAAVKSNMNILRRVIGEDIELVTVLDAMLRPVQADEGQIEQVLLNLAVNARDAMARGGKLTIRTANAAKAAGSDQVILAVSDTGCGMDAATQLRVFEPFFTTKESGRGTGLGLSIVSGIVKQNGGTIELDTKPGEGTTFKIYLPSAEAAGPTAAPRLVIDGRTGSETILVVEDDAAVRQFICTILQDAGYRVSSARHGDHALEIVQQREDSFGLVVTDLVMPHMSGPVLIEKLRRRTPEVRALYTSGYADDAVARHGDLDPVVPFIRKPFSSESFLQKVRETLDAPVPHEELRSCS
jgi:two-component system cell cycle sensor histidine kinase/response regulator CckA